jgi:translation initiation factor 2 subunit 1
MSQSATLDATTENTEDSLIHSRYYEKSYPNINDIVVTQVKSITDMGIYVSLLEYDGIEAMIPLSEYTNRRFRSLASLTRVGRIEFSLVTHVDQVKGFIDLSKKRISSDEISKYDEKWNKSKCVQSIMSRLSFLLHIPLLELHSQITWPLYQNYSHPYDAFRLHLSDSDQIPEIQQISEEIRIALLDQVKRRIQPSLIKVRAEIDLNCFGVDGVEAIKLSLKEGLSVSDPKYPLLIKLISSPTYLLTTTVSDKIYGLQMVNEACKLINKKIKEFGGTMVFKMEPRVISDQDEKEMMNEIDRLAKEADEEENIDLD